MKADFYTEGYEKHGRKNVCLFYRIHCVDASVTGAPACRRGRPPQPLFRAEVKLMEANKALDAVNGQSSAFYAQLSSVIAEINEFRSRPYWNEFEQILLEYPSLRDPDNEAEITPEMESRLSQWSLKWKTAGSKPWKTTSALWTSALYWRQKNWLRVKSCSRYRRVSGRGDYGGLGRPRKGGKGNLLGCRGAGQIERGDGFLPAGRPGVSMVRGSMHGVIRYILLLSLDIFTDPFEDARSRFLCPAHLLFRKGPDLSCRPSGPP